MPATPGTIRESGLATGVTWAMALWALIFAVNTLLTADRLTSPQWRSLMTVPGGKWFWVALFGGAAVVEILGLVRTRYWLRATALALIGLGCGGIAVFYIIAPAFELGPITLGYWPWFVPAGIGLFGSVANWRPILWF